MLQKLKKLTIILLLVLGTPNISLAKAEISNTDFLQAHYVWEDAKTISTTIKKQDFVLKRTQTNPYSNTDSTENYAAEIFGQDFFAYVTSETELEIPAMNKDKKTRIALVFKKDSDKRAEGKLYWYENPTALWRRLLAPGGSNTTTWITDPKGVAPGKFTKLTAGAIQGRLVPVSADGKENGWQTPVDSVFHGALNIVSESFLGEGIWAYIKDEGDNVISQKHLTKEDYGWRYNDMPLSEMEGGGLWSDTTYLLRIALTDKVSNCTGNADNGNGQCRYDWRGTVSFTLDKDGTIHIPNPDPYANYTEKNADGKKVTDLTRENGMNLAVVEYFSSPMTEALGQAIKWLSTAITNWTDRLAGWIETALQEANLEDVQPAWMQIRNTSISLLLLGIIIIVFANVLSIDVDQYGAQRMIPRLVMNVVLAYFSFLIIKVLLEVANILQLQFKALLSSGQGIAIPFHVDLTSLSASDLVAQLGTILFLFAMLIGVIIALFYLFLVLLARVVFIKFLLIAAPVAFILGIMPFTESLLKRWWSEVFQWIFMGPAVMGILLVGTIILKNAPTAGAIDLNVVNTNSLTAFRQIFYLGTAAITYFLAASIPTQMGGQLMGAVSKKALGLMKKAPGYRTAEQMLAQRSKDGDRKITNRASKWRAGLGQAPVIGRLAGYNSKLERGTAYARQQKAIVGEKEKLLEDLSTDDLKKRSMSKMLNKIDLLATMRVLSSRAGGIQGAMVDADGAPVSDEKQAMFKRHEALFNRFADDQKLTGNMFKDQSAALINFKSTLQEAATESVGSKSPHELNVGSMQALVNAASDPTHKGHAKAIEAFQRYTADNMRILKERAPATTSYLRANHQRIEMQPAAVTELMREGTGPQPPRPQGPAGTAGTQAPGSRENPSQGPGF